MQSRKLVARPLGKNFHAAIMIVPHPPGDAENVRLALDKPAKANALDASADQKAAGLDGFISVRHF
jgi:hypothetical protein